MKFEHIAERLAAYKAEGKSLFTTSSFQTHSLVLLHIISRIDRTIPVYFLNTGYHFPDTLAFRDQVAALLDLQVVPVGSEVPKSMQRDANGYLLFASNPDRCCQLNKTQPMDAVLRHHDVWINGVRADQSAVRAAMKEEQPAPHGVTRFHPMLDWTPRDIYAYLREHDLPRHPMESQGYTSIGCEPCTRKMTPEMQEREARWFGLNKTECGLNTELAQAK